MYRTTSSPTCTIVLLLLFFFFFFFFVLLPSITRRRHHHHHIPPPSCTSQNYLVGRSTSPTSLAHFITQFPSSTPPTDLCILFLVQPHHDYTLFRLPNIHLLPVDLGLYAAYHIALAHATKILLADDDTFFDTTHYGIGKSDVSPRVHKFSDLLPVPAVTRQAHAGVINSAAVLTGRTILERTLPLERLTRSGGAAIVFDTLTNVTAFHQEPLITSFLSFTPDVREEHHSFQPRFSLDMIRAPDADEQLKKGLYHPPGSMGRLAKPVLFERLAAWVLPWDNTVSGYVVQRALWEAGRGVLVVPGMDVWRIPVGQKSRKNEQIEEIVKFLEIIEIPPMLRFVDEVYIFLLEGLWRRGLLEKGVVSQVRDFHATLRRRGVARLLRRPYIMEMDQRLDTAVCVTGQMRSAAFTARNLMESLREGIAGGFDVFIVTERDDRSAAARLFNATSVRYSTVVGVHEEWVQLVRKSPLVHETMSTERQVRNYLKQLWDLRECERSVREKEIERGRKYRWMVRVRPDTVFTKPVSSRYWTGSLQDGRHGLRLVVFGKRQSYYALNDRFFAGDRALMGRLMTCHDLFGYLLKTGKIYSRRADGAHMMFKKMVNSERLLGRCAVWKRVPLKALPEIDVRRVALSDGAAKWREFSDVNQTAHGCDCT